MTPNNLNTQDVLREGKVIAVVGLSTQEYKDSHRVPAYMQRAGYRIIPINPRADHILGEQAYVSIRELPDDLAAEVEIVNIFRPSAEVAGIVQQALDRLPNLIAIWAQKGIFDDEAAERARAAGVTMIQDRCMLIEHMLSS